MSSPENSRRLKLGRTSIRELSSEDAAVVGGGTSISLPSCPNAWNTFYCVGKVNFYTKVFCPRK